MPGVALGTGKAPWSGGNSLHDARSCASRSFVPAGSGGFAAIQTAAPGFGVELIPVGVHDGEEIERGITEFAHGPNAGLIVVGPLSSMQRYRDLVVDLAARYSLPAVYAGVAYAGTNAL
jgi:hypothetical protein